MAEDGAVREKGNTVGDGGIAGATAEEGEGGTVSWRSWAVSIVVAVLLAAAFTWILGNRFHSRGHGAGGACGEPAAAGSGACGGACCGEPPAAPPGKGGATP